MSNNEGKKCIFCDEICEHQRYPSRSKDFYSCSSHGNYYTTDSYKIENEKERSVLRGYLLETKNRESNIILTKEEVARIKKDPIIPKTAMQKLNKIMLSIYKLDRGFNTSFEKLSPSVGYALDDNEMSAMLNSLCELGYLKYNEGAYKITISGLEYAEKLLTTNKDSIKVFVAMGFKKDLLHGYEYAIKPACKHFGFQASVVSDKEHNNDINDEIISGIKTSKFVIVDLTYNNSGAYFEAGFAQGLGLPVIRCCKESWFNETDKAGHRVNQLHFDIEHYNMIFWKDEKDLETKLKNRISATII